MIRLEQNSGGTGLIFQQHKMGWRNCTNTNSNRTVDTFGFLTTTSATMKDLLRQNIRWQQLCLLVQTDIDTFPLVSGSGPYYYLE